MIAETEEKQTRMEKLENGHSAAEPKYKGWKAMPYVIGNETCEKLGTIGTASNLLVYLTTVFNIKSVTAVTTLNAFQGTTYVTPVIGAFLSDTYLGRYTTLGISSVSSLLGMLILTMTSAIDELHPRKCNPGSTCEGPSAGQITVLVTSFLFLVIGAGGIRSCNFPFGADQFNPNTESGKRGINSFFNWFYLTFTAAMMISSTIIIYIQSNISWTLGLAIPTGLMLFSCIFFFTGSKIYVKVKPEGSPVTSISQVIVAAFKKRRLILIKDNYEKSLFDPPHFSSLVTKLPYTNQFRFLDKAAVITSEDKIMQSGFAENPWRLCSVQQVETVKCLLRILPIWSTGIFFYIAWVQQSSYVVFEAFQSDRRLGRNFQIPAGSFSVFNMLALTIWIPIYDLIIVPSLRKITGKEEVISVLQRIGIGIMLSIVAMIVAGITEDRRRYIALNEPTLGIAPSGGAISSMSSLWLIFQLALLGLAEGFTMVGQTEFCYKQFPENMRSIAGGLLCLSLGLSNYLSGLMVTVVNRTTSRNGHESWLSGDLNKGRLDLFYYLIAMIGALNFMLFLVLAKWYRYKGLQIQPEMIALETNISKVSST